MPPSPLFNSRTFSSKKNLVPISSHSLFPPFPSPLATTNMLSLSTDLCILDISFKWNHTICGLWCLASFTQHKVFKVHPCCSMYQCCVPFLGWIIFHCVEHHILFIQSTIDRHLYCLHFGAIMNNTVMNIYEQVFVCACFLLVAYLGVKSCQMGTL